MKASRVAAAIMMQENEEIPLNEPSEQAAVESTASATLPAPGSAAPAPTNVVPAAAATPTPVPTATLPPVAAPADTAPAPTAPFVPPTRVAETPTVESTGSAAPPQEAEVETAPGTTEEGEDIEPPPLASEPTGVIGLGAKMLMAKTAELAENERVRQSVQYIKDKSQAVQQNEKVQQSVAYVKTKATDVMESERVQKSVEYAKDKAAVAATKATEVSEKVTEKTKAGVEYAKEKARGLREGAGTVWESGAGSIQRVRSNVSNLAWKGSARDTLDIAAREEQWKGIKIQGAEEIAVPARTEHTCCYHVSKGSTLRWTFRVKDNDIGFGVRMRVQEWGGSREDEVLATERYDCTDTISGSWVADEDRTMVLVFDNKYSKLRSKTVAYFTGTEKPPVFVESPSADAAAMSSDAAAADPAPAATEVAAAPAAPAAEAAPARPIV